MEEVIDGTEEEFRPRKAVTSREVQHTITVFLEDGSEQLVLQREMPDFSWGPTVEELEKYPYFRMNNQVMLKVVRVRVVRGKRKPAVVYSTPESRSLFYG